MLGVGAPGHAGPMCDTNPSGGPGDAPPVERRPLTLRLLVAPRDPIQGRIEPEGGAHVSFVGWMDLIAAINRLRGASR
jgi:hypothetical protein